MRLGHGQRRTVVMLWLWTGLLSGAALVPTYTKEGERHRPFVVAGLALALFALFHPGGEGRREQQERALIPPAAPPATTRRPPASSISASARRKRA